MTVQVTVDVKELDRIVAELPDAVERVVEREAFAIQAAAMALAPVRTGYLRASGSVEPAEDRFSRYIHFAAGYAAFVEQGTRYQRPHPFLTPAVEGRRDDFAAALRALAGLVKD